MRVPGGGKSGNRAAIFIAVGLGALTVTLLHNPMAVIPHPPYGPWIFVRMLHACSLGALGLLLLFGIEDDSVVDEPESDPVMHWRVVGVAFFISALASATFIAVSAFVDYLDRALA